MKKLRLGILISGRGSNMQALAEACAEPDFPAEVACVIANRPDAGGLAAAEAMGIRTATVDHKEFPDKATFEAALDRVLREARVDLVCLAGFMRVLSAGFIGGWEGRIINIHPSLLPAYKGLNVHERVLADGQAKSGCTVHYVVRDVDSGAVIVQREVKVAADDTVESLSARILKQEHIAYVEAVRNIAFNLTEKLSAIENN